MTDFWTIVRIDGNSIVYRNGRKEMECYHFKGLTPEELRIFNEVKEKYFKALDKI